MALSSAPRPWDRWSGSLDYCCVGHARPLNVHQVQNLVAGRTAALEALAVALVHQELVIVEGEDLADGGELAGLGLGQRIRVLRFDAAAGNVDGHDARERTPGAGAPVLNQGALQRDDQRS